ncbi:Sulfhydryl oxidase 2, partial [Geodia barretti]
SPPLLSLSLSPPPLSLSLLSLSHSNPGWSPVVKLGVIDCSAKQSYSTCTDYGVHGYPTMRFFQPGGDPKSATDNYHGSREVEDVQEAIINRLQSWEGPFAAKWPHFQPLEGDHLLAIPGKDWTPAALIFEDQDSFVGRKLMLDLLDLRELQVYRVLPSNVSDRVLYNYQL